MNTIIKASRFAGRVHDSPVARPALRHVVFRIPFWRFVGFFGVCVSKFGFLSYAAWKAAGSEGKLSQSYTWCAHGRRCGTLFGGLVLVGGLTE